jgi:hypothetical protein
MYGIYANIGGILMVNVTIYTIHGSYGIIHAEFLQHQLWKITIFNGKTHYKWQFSIAMLNYQRVI